MKMKNWLSKSIKNQGITIFTVPFLLVMIFLLIYYPGKEKELSIENAKTQVHTLSEMLAFSFGAGLSDSNFDLVQAASDWAKKDKNVVFISLLDEKGETIIEFNPGNLKVSAGDISSEEYDDENNLIKDSDSINYKNKYFGKIILMYSLESISDNIRSSTITTVIIISVIFITVLGFVIFVFNKIVKRIVELRDATKEASRGNLSVKIQKSYNDELGDVSDSFNKMLENILNANKALEEEKKSVEKKVEEAVKESEDQKNYFSHAVEVMLVEMKKFAEGDLNVHLNTGKEDDIGKLFNGFNTSVENLRELIKNLRESVETAATSSSEIFSSTDQLATGSREQSGKTSEVAAAVEQMTSTILETTKNSATASENAKKAGEFAAEGGIAVENTIEGMKRISEVVKSASETIKQLGKSSIKIGEIVEVINDIADQTNLLALNAAIEAARAGEQGRGFAVVADEVRKLAERTSKATKEIAEMIKQIQKDTEGAVSSINKGTEEVEKGKDIACKAGESLQEIIKSSLRVLDEVNQVASASEEQSTTAEQISRNIEAISSVTNQSAAGIQEVAKSAENLNRLTENLKQIVNQFIIDENKESNYSVRTNGKIIKTY